ncbi:hypothetical protein [uncultured Pseudoalteromonas sp.]|uniref:hypothetical protein n=1 Tax=uncultured Pseudoalteromonas sp. TaxID=114053 RepID=UPI0030C7C2C2
MNNEHDIINSLTELENFLVMLENGGLGLKGVAGVGLATNNKDGSHFVAVFDDKQQLLLARGVTDEVFENGKDMVRNGVGRTH